MTSGERQSGQARQNLSVITDARVASSEEMAGRVRRYAITMAFRTACFIGMIFVPGIWRWILFACAVFLPYVAVLFANQAHQRGMTNTVEPAPAPADAKQLTIGPEDVIHGDVSDADDEPADGRRERHRDPDGRHP
jgi:hypothetical protein